MFIATERVKPLHFAASEMSLINRNPLVTQGGDMCVVLSAYGIFLPLGRVWV